MSRWLEEVEPGGAGVPPCWQQGSARFPGSSQGDPALQQCCLGRKFVLVIKTSVVFSEIFRASESCS